MTINATYDNGTGFHRLMDAIEGRYGSVVFGLAGGCVTVSTSPTPTPAT
jgi:hypothetical protein